ncbi:MAG TPA: DUF2330 domain-containing protein [Casimicrobiaceae bacterium]|nr:DUF2330 domain-containing protein [Casimicrobiaceae bacterium]
MTLQSFVRRPVAVSVLALASAFVSAPAQPFCGFFVGKADAQLFNKASQVIMVRDGNRTVISMLNEYRGEPSEFALVVPVPQVLERGQIRIGDRRIFERIDAFSAPRLAEYFDPNPCEAKIAAEMASMNGMLPRAAPAQMRKDKALGVSVEARYTVGEYDIVILSAKESNGLETWLRTNGYRIPRGAAAALQPYIRQNLKFFVAKVNLEEHARSGQTWLSPLQFAFESEKFMLPVRLGMLNAQGAQDLVIYVLTRNGRVETTNYRAVKLPSDVDVPLYVRNDFAGMYRAVFDEQARREDLRAVFTEYFWDMSWCDPCAADPLTPDELRQAGAFWVGQANGTAPSSGAQPVMLTRLHLRYTRDTLPEDLMFQQTADRQPFQVRYVLRHPWSGSADACAAAPAYFRSVHDREEHEATTLASLTGWSATTIRASMNLTPRPQQKWWESLWNTK